MQRTIQLTMKGSFRDEEPRITETLTQMSRKCPIVLQPIRQFEKEKDEDDFNSLDIMKSENHFIQMH